MLGPFIISFLVLFVVIMVAATVGSKYFDNKRKKQVSSMLKTAGEKEPEVSISNLLMEPSEDNRSWMERFIEGLDFAQKLQIQMQPAGLDWTPVKFLILSVMCSFIGGMVGVKFPVIGFGISSVVFGLMTALLP
jgi:Flp pilus assembly protein TadB